MSVPVSLVDAPVSPGVGRPVFDAPAPLPCATAPASRWIARKGDYRAAGTYGLADGEWLSSVAGVERIQDGSIWIFDSQNARLVRLSPDLSEHEELAAEGPGPGELAQLPGVILESMGKGWMTASDSVVFLFDGRALSVFGPDGEFRHYLSGFRPNEISALNVHGFHHASGHLLYSVDSGRVPMFGDGEDGERRMVTWIAEEDGPARLFAHLIPPIPRMGSGRFSPPGQADPLWSGGEDCVFFSDGERPWLIMAEVNSGRLDSLRLPDVDAPDFDDPEVREDFEKMMMMSGREGAEMPEPTSVKHWEAMSVDPDGFVWMLPAAEAERHENRPDEPLRVHVVAPSTGEVTSVSVPAFPVVFGSPGEYYAIEEDPELEVPVLTRFTSVEPSDR